MAEFGASDWFSKAEPFGYFRISTDKQSVEDKKQTDPKKKATIKRQIKEVQDGLKAQGLPQIKAANIFAEVASGSKGDRTQWRKLREAALQHKGRAFVVVKDPSRWARNVDNAVLAWAPLKDQGIPIYAVGTGIQTGTVADKRPSENFFFLLNSGFAAQTSEVQSKKAEAGRDRQRAEGAADFKGQSVYPFAVQDPLTVFENNLEVLGTPKGVPSMKRIIDSASNPQGMSFSAATRFIDRVQALKAALSPSEYQEYRDFRQRMRERLQRLESDPWAGGNNKEGKLDYRANALYRMSGLYLKDPDKFPMPTEDFLNKVERDFAEYLSDKDKKKRGKRRR